MLEYEVRGRGFLSFPRDLFGSISHTQSPTQYYYDDRNAYWVREVFRSDDVLILQGPTGIHYTGSVWLGTLCRAKKGEILHLFSYPD